MNTVKTEFKIYYETMESGQFESLVHPVAFETLNEARTFAKELLDKETTLGATLVQSIVRDEAGQVVFES